MKFILQKLTLILILLIGIVSCDFKITEEKFTLFPFENDSLDIPNKIKIKELINDTSVGINQKINKKTYFIPINFEARSASVGKYHRVPLADLVVTSDINKYAPIRFEDEFSRFGESRISFLFFVPSNDSLAISKEKLDKQFNANFYIDKNSLITSDYSVLSYKYLPQKKGFEIFHSTPIPFTSDITATEKLYQSIDILRMAKHLKDTTASTLNWKKLNYVVPTYFNRYFENSLLDTIVLNTNEQPENFEYSYRSNDLEVIVSVVKDSSSVKLLGDMQRTPLNEDVDIEEDFKKESIRVFKTYIQSFGIDEVTQKEGKNTFFITAGFDKFILHFIPKKKMIFVIEDTDSFNTYSDEIYYNYFKKNLIPKLEK